eukprot:Tamp_09734.p1 GENE.Tamp_09734~~Tamp_09734.p1  ORF type:complete len:594 (+),score=133.74 Tamp_09734:118-1782(+)
MYDQLSPGPASRRERKQQLLLRAETALHRAARLRGRAEGGHAGPGDEDHAGAAAHRGLGEDEDGETSRESDGDESDMDFEDLVRLYGPLPPLQRRRRKQTGSAGADGEVEEDDDVDPKKKYNVAMALILMLMVLGLLAVIFAQAHGQELWLDRQRRQCEQSIEEAATRERGKVAGPLLELERKKWRREFDQQIQRTRQDAEEECEKLQREHRRNLTICNLTIADLRHKCDSEVERLRREHATSAPSSRSASPTAPASVPAEEGACKRSDKAILTCAEECAGWCRQEQMTAAQGRAKELCGDEVGKAVAAERKRLQERALKSRRRAIEKVLQGNHSGAASEVAAVVCVSKDDCNMEQVIIEAIDRGRKDAQAALICGLEGVCDTSPELEVAINEHLNTISKCAFDGSCPAPDVLTMELKTAREQDWKTVLNFLEEQAFDAGEGGEGKEKEGEGGAGLGVEEGDNNIRSEIRRIFQRLLMKSREEEGRRVRERTEAQYQQMLLLHVERARVQEQQAAAQVREKEVKAMKEELTGKIEELTAVINEQERRLASPDAR